MLYRSYVEKLERWKRAFDRFWRLRFVLLSGFLFILAGIGAILGIQGIVHDVRVPESVVYGEAFVPTAEAIFGEAQFEYRPLGEETWTREVPILAGEYECRAFGRSVVGTDRPADAIPFTIEPAVAHIRTTATSLVYGESLPFTTSDLKYGDKLVVDGFLSEEVEGEKLNVQADPAKIKIVNAAGEDVTFCYTFDPQESLIDDLRRPVSLSTASETFVYDGTAHECHGLTAEGLVEGHTVEATFTSITDFGSCLNALTSVHIFDGDGNDVTDHYRIDDSQKGTLTVEKRPITVRTKSETFTYDGKTHSYDTAEVGEGTLAGGQTLVRDDSLPVLNVGTYSNVPTIRIMAGETDVTANYDITPEYGTVVVEKKVLKLSTDPTVLTYDGQPHSFDKINVDALDGLAEGQIISVVPVEVTDVRYDGEEVVSYPYAPEFKILTEDGETVISKDNYDIDVSGFGTITVLRRPIDVVAKTETVTYNGAAYDYSTFKALDSYETPKDGADRGLLSGDSIVFTNAEELIFTAANLDGYDNIPEIEIYSGETRVTENYEIELTEGKITILRRPIEIVAKTEAVTYKGAAYDYSTYEQLKSYETPQDDADRGLLSGDSIVFTNAADLIFTAANLGGYDNTPEIEIYSGETPVTANYEIELTGGKITILRRPITITTQSYDAVYDGQTHDLSSVPADYTDEGEGVGLLSSLFHRLEATENHPYYGVISEKNKTEYEIYVGETDVTDNYNIEYINGDVTIAPRPVTVVTRTEQFTYDGTEHVYGVDTFESGTDDLVHGHSFVISGGEYKFTAANGYDNKPLFEIVDENGEEVTANYEVKRTNGQITILRRKINITTKSAEFTYDGKPHRYDEPTIENGEGELIKGHAYKITSGEEKYVFEAANDGEANAPEFEIIDENGVNVTSNYDFDSSLNYGTVTIHKQPISVTMASDDFTYDGQPHVYGTDTFQITDGKLADGQKFFITSEKGKYTFENASGDPWKNIPDFKIVDENGENVSENYDIAPSAGYVTIRFRTFYVTTDSRTWVYDGNEHWEENCIIAPTDETTGILDGHVCNIEVTDLPTVLTVSTVDNKLEFTWSVMAGGENVTANYTVSILGYGTLTVEKRPITIRTKDGTWEYDGEEHFETECTFTPESDGVGLLESLGHRVVAKEGYSTFLNVSSSGQNFVDYSIMADETDVTANYEITREYGIVTIAPRPVTVVTRTEEFTYDGTEHTYGVETFVSGEERLVLDHKFVISGGEYRFTAANEGGHTNRPTVYVTEDGRSESENYAVKVIPGTITIRKRPITITTQSYNAVYDGKKHDLSEPADYTKEGKDEGLLSSLTHELVPQVPRIDCDVIDNDENETKYDIYVGGANVTDSYAISYTNGFVTITKRPIQIEATTETFTYNGQVFDYSTYDKLAFCEETNGKDSGLLSGDRIVFTNAEKLKFIDANVDGYKNRPEIVIYSGEKPVTKNYEIELTEGQITILKRQINITTKSEQFTYDGKPHVYDGSTFTNGAGELVEGHAYKITSKEATYIFEKAKETPYDNAPDFKIVDESGKEVTANYDFDGRVHYGAVTIDFRKIEVEMVTEQFTYDGKPHVYGTDTFDITDGTLADNQEFSITSGEEKYIFENAKETPYDNAPDFKIVDENGEEVTANYEVKRTNGQITIQKRHITIDTAGDSWVYDGTDHAKALSLKPTIGGEGLGTNDKCEPIGDTIGQFRDVKDSGENKVGYRIWNAKGVDVTENYAVVDGEGHYGTVTISQRPIKITAKTETVVYQGEAYDYSTSDKLEVCEKSNGRDRGLLSGDSIVFTNAEALKFTNVKEGGHQNRPIVTIHSAEGDVTENYDIDFTEGLITILKRPLTVITPSDEWVYDGRKHSNSEFTFAEPVYDRVTGSGLVEGHKASYDVTYEKEILNVIDGPTDNVLTVQITSIMAGGEDVTANYDTEHLNYTNGTLAIISRPLYVTTATHDWIYDGEAHSDSGFSIAEPQEGKLDASGLVSGQAYKADTSNLPTITNVCKLPSSEKNIVTNAFTPEFTFYTSESRETVVDALNYDIHVIPGILTVSRRPINITTKTMTWVYDGTEHDYYSQPEDYEKDEGTEERGLLAQHEIRQMIQPPQSQHINVWDAQENEATFRIGIKGSADTITSNYAITYIRGTITITPRPMRIRTLSISYVYNGSERSYRGYEKVQATPEDDAEKGYGLLEGQNILIWTVTTVKEVCEPTKNVLTFKVVTDGNVDVTANYVDLTEEGGYVTYGTIQITPRPIKIVAKTETVTYQGKAFDYSTYDKLGVWETTNGKDRGLLSSDSIVFTNAEALRFTDASDTPYENIPEIAIYEYGRDVTGNYQIDFTGGEITIRKRHIAPKTKADEFVYDGTQHSYGNRTIECGVNEQGESQLAEGHWFSITSEKSTYTFIDANEEGYTNAPTFVILDAWGTDVSANYDIAPTDCGKIVIHKRPVTIVSGSYTWVYDGEAHEYASAYALDGDWDSGLLINHEIRVTVAASSRITDITDTMSEEDGYYDGIGYVDNIIAVYQILVWGDDVTKNYDVTVQNDGKLRIKSPIVIFLYSSVKTFDNTPLSDEDFDFEVLQKPADVNAEDITIDTSEIHVVKPSDSLTFASAKGLVNFCYKDVLLSKLSGADQENRVDFDPSMEDDELLYEIEKRHIVVTSASYDAARHGRDEFVYHKLIISDDWLFEEKGGTLRHNADECIFTGVLRADQREAENTFKRGSFLIYDENGNEITYDAFEIEFRFGTLRWIEGGTNAAALDLPALPVRKEM